MLQNSQHKLVQAWGASKTDSKYHARVVNTCEVLLNFLGWVVVPNKSLISCGQLQTAIEDVVLWFNEIRKGTPDDPKPLLSLTHKIATIRVNALTAFTFSRLLIADHENNLNLINKVTRKKIEKIMSDCVEWLILPNQGISNGTLFQSSEDQDSFHIILSTKAFISYLKYAKAFSLDIDPKLLFNLQNAIRMSTNWIKDHETLLDEKKHFLAMALEILIYNDVKDTRIQKILDALLTVWKPLMKESKLVSTLWADSRGCIVADDGNIIKDWTHITAVWALEGLSLCTQANLLSEDQKKIFKATVAIALLKRGDDGFFDSTQDKKEIFKTALYNYVLALAYNVFFRKPEYSTSRQPLPPVADKQCIEIHDRLDDDHRLSDILKDMKKEIISEVKKAISEQHESFQISKNINFEPPIAQKTMDDYLNKLEVTLQELKNLKKDIDVLQAIESLNSRVQAQDRIGQEIKAMAGNLSEFQVIISQVVDKIDIVQKFHLQQEAEDMKEIQKLEGILTEQMNRLMTLEEAIKNFKQIFAEQQSSVLAEVRQATTRTIHFIKLFCFFAFLFFSLWLFMNATSLGLLGFSLWQKILSYF